MPVVDLTVDRNLLCPNFDGYKLSFDTVPVLRQSFQRNPLKLEPHVNQYSLLHVELFAKHNLLFSDPWSRHNSYYINTAHELVLCSYDELRGQPRDQRVVYKMQLNDHGDGHEHLVGDYNYSLRFISEKYCVVCDGKLSYHLLETGDRMRNTQWQLVTRTQIQIDSLSRGFVLYDARLDIVQERKQISLVAGHVHRGEAAEKHVMQLIWSHWTLNPQTSANWKYEQCEQLETSGSLYYCAFEPRAESLIVCSNGQLQTQAAAQEQTKEQSNKATTPAYSWRQTEEHLLIDFAMAKDTSCKDYEIICSSSQALVKYQELALLQGKLYAAVEENQTSWNVEGDVLQLKLVKQMAEQWPQLLQSEEGPKELEMEQQELPETEPDRLPIPNLEDPIEDCDFPLATAEQDIKMGKYEAHKSLPNLS